MVDVIRYSTLISNPKELVILFCGTAHASQKLDEFLPRLGTKLSKDYSENEHKLDFRISKLEIKEEEIHGCNLLLDTSYMAYVANLENLVSSRFIDNLHHAYETLDSDLSEQIPRLIPNADIASHLIVALPFPSKMDAERNIATASDILMQEFKGNETRALEIIAYLRGLIYYATQSTPADLYLLKVKQR